MRSITKHLVAPIIAVSGTNCMLTPLLFAQDEKKTTAIAVTAEGNQQDDIRKKVAEALEKAGIAEEMKAKILKEIAIAEEKAQQAAKRGELAAKKAEAAEKMAKDAELQVIELNGAKPGDVVELNVTGEGGVQQRLKQLRARVLRDMADQKYRIGVACRSEMADDGSKIEKPEGQEGLVVESVFPDSPAAQAGVKEGDLLLMIDEKPLHDIDQLMKAVQAAGKEKKALNITIARDEEKLTLQVKPAEIKDLDRVVENIELNMPSGGWLFQGTPLQEMPVPGVQGMNAARAFAFSAGDRELKAEIEKLRKEVAELKEMIRELKK